MKIDNLNGMKKHIRWEANFGLDREIEIKPSGELMNQIIEAMNVGLARSVNRLYREGLKTFIC